jgi:hypothetical protein
MPCNQRVAAAIATADASSATSPVVTAQPDVVVVVVVVVVEEEEEEEDDDDDDDEKVELLEKLITFSLTHSENCRVSNEAAMTLSVANGPLDPASLSLSPTLLPPTTTRLTETEEGKEGAWRSNRDHERP